CSARIEPCCGPHRPTSVPGSKAVSTARDSWQQPRAVKPRRQVSGGRIPEKNWCRTMEIRLKGEPVDEVG
ncbi:MAG: hypothetical protein NTV89_18905, partial [Proteobacteria bacterium]|nr:hypothetical protein [Pseudomonadota bacterium]